MTGHDLARGAAQASPYSFRRLSPVELPRLNEFHNRCRGTSRSVEEAEWLYERNPYGETIILAAFDRDSELVGIRPAVAWRFFRMGEERPAYQFVDAAVAPEHRGRGVFRHLVTMVCALAEEAEASLFSFPNESSLSIYLGVPALHCLGPCEVQAKILSWSRYMRYRLTRDAEDAGHGAVAAETAQLATGLRERDVSLEPIRAFESDFEEIHHDLGRRVASFTLRRREFLNWRYFGRPHTRYHVALIRQSGRTRGYLVVRVRDAIAHLVDVFLAPDWEVALAASRLVTRWAGAMGAIAIYFTASPGNFFHHAFRRGRLVLKRRSQPVVIDTSTLNSLASRLRRRAGPGDFYFVMGDNDVL
ncbi:MAG: GNAT family N-acetyltransferase [Candidatus Rokubacteria bacterium]|nr:GNAT family N-acetyltransferase [Candidatus Rokubacteria bacterium]